MRLTDGENIDTSETVDHCVVDQDFRLNDARGDLGAKSVMLMVMTSSPASLAPSVTIIVNRTQISDT